MLRWNIGYKIHYSIICYTIVYFIRHSTILISPILQDSIIHMNDFLCSHRLQNRLRNQPNNFFLNPRSKKQKSITGAFCVKARLRVSLLFHSNRNVEEQY